VGAEESRAAAGRLTPGRIGAVAAGLWLAVWLAAWTAEAASKRRGIGPAGSLAETLTGNPIIQDVAHTYRGVPVQLYIVAGLVFIVGLLLRVPLLLCLLGGGVFLSLPLVQGMETEQIIWWGAVGSVVVLVVHHLVTSSRDRRY
jgi:hypothetical protein